MRFLSLVCLCLAVSATACSQEGLDRATVSRINQKTADFMAKTGAPGVSVAIVKNGIFVWSSGYGLADIENNVPATDETMFRLASVSKAISATGAMWLVQRGKVDLDVPVQKYCPDFPLKSAPITTREILGHTAGIRHYKSDSPNDPEVGNTKHFDSMEESLRLFASDDLLSPPGKQYHYSTLGYTLLGCVIEGASGQKFSEFMNQTIFVPVGMLHTQVDSVHRIIPHRAQGYQKIKGGDIINSDLADTSYKIPGGGLTSNAQDLARLEVALLNDKILLPETRRQMWTKMSALPTDRDPTRGYGLGWTSTTVLGMGLIGHAGAQQRVSTLILMQPDQKAGAVVLCNLEGLDLDLWPFAAELLKITMDSTSTH